MACEEKLERLISLESGGLDATEEAEVRAHLRECEVCTRRLDQVRGIGSRISESLAGSEAAPDIADAVMARIPARRPLIWPWAAAAAAACLIILLLVNKPPARQVAVSKPRQVVKAPAVHQQVREEIARPSLSHPNLKPVVRVAAHREHRPVRQRPHPRQAPQIASRQVDVRIDVRIEGDRQEAQLAAGSVEQTIEIAAPSAGVETPPDPELANIERPPLKTVVRADPAAVMSDQM